MSNSCKTHCALRSVKMVAAMLALLVLLPSNQAVDLNVFYPFGTAKLDNIVEPGDDLSSMRIDLRDPIVLYNISYNSVYVNTNGHVTFGGEILRYHPDRTIPTGLGTPFAAVFLSDVDTTSTGRVFYRWTDQREILGRAALDIRTHFSGFENFMPTLLFIATWEEVGYYNARDDKVNTFQIVLVTNGRDSFALFHYLDNGIGWMQSEGKLFPTEDPLPQAGFDSGKYSMAYTVKGNIVTGSNVDIPGVWMFQIGDVGGQNVRSTDIQTGDVTVFEVETSQDNCYDGASTCHPQAQCVEYRDSFCCQCVEPFFGNGLYCAEQNKPQSIDGPVRGRLNGIQLDRRSEMHTYMMTDKGRSYTSITRVAKSLSTAMETLTFIGGIGGWMYAPRKNPNTKNGFMVTGSKFNVTTQITFSGHNGEQHVVRSQQIFKGHYDVNKVAVDTYLEGSMPDIDYNTSISFDAYKETFRKIAPGTMKSSVNRVYRVKGVGYRYNWESIITYEECGEEASRGMGDVMTLDVTRLYAHLLNSSRSADIKTVRFATQSSIIIPSEDPCKLAEGVCHEKADCVPMGADFKCSCRAGYTGNGEDVCTDIDECVYHPCGPNSRCYNVVGAFQCQCDTGYVKDGSRCRAQTCRDVDICSDNAQCVFDPILKEYGCECMDEFSGDGYTCESAMAGYSSCDACDRYALCTSDEDTGRYYCECRPGYSGDGTRCTMIENCRPCNRYASCEFDVSISDFKCVCNRGYKGDGETCERQDCREDESMCDPEGGLCWLDTNRNFSFCRCNYGYQGDGFDCRLMGCDRSNYCDRNAECVFDGQMHSCVCKDGYNGDGRRCRKDRPSQPKTCTERCDTNARCVRNQDRGYYCRCNRGYEGDGRRCRQAEVPCNQVNNCDSNAECIYNPDVAAYQCRCSRGYEGDGTYCRRRAINDCRRNPRLCSSNAECVQGREEAYVCLCRHGYRGDGARCERVITQGNSLVYAQGNKIMRVSADDRSGDNGQIIAYEPGMLAVGVEVDCEQGDVYWTDAAKGVIKRSKLDGTDMQNVVNGMKSPEGIAIDFVARNMFFTDSDMDSLMVSKLNGTGVKTLVNTEMANPRAVVLDVNRGVVYWTDWNRDLPQIERINMDGTERDVLVREDIRLPNGLAFDPYAQTLCWGDAGTHRIECIRSDGSSRRVIFENAMWPFDIAMLNNVIYWTDWKMREIPNVDQNGGGENRPLKQVMGGNGRAYGITAIRDRCPNARNSCGQNNGGCKYLCLPTARGGRTCGCPDGMDPRVCQQ